MRSERWLTALAAELRRHGLEPDTAANVVAEADAHLRDSREQPVFAFGPPERYAATIAATLAETAARASGATRPAKCGRMTVS